LLACTTFLVRSPMLLNHSEGQRGIMVGKFASQKLAHGAARPALPETCSDLGAQAISLRMQAQPGEIFIAVGALPPSCVSSGWTKGKETLEAAVSNSGAPARGRVGGPSDSSVKIGSHCSSRSKLRPKPGKTGPNQVAGLIPLRHAY
jgi:hypothetical protein